jgi:hypothetical protein
MAIRYMILFVRGNNMHVNLLLQTFQSVLIICYHIISTDKDPGLRIESFAVINLRGVSTNRKFQIV